MRWGFGVVVLCEKDGDEDWEGGSSKRVEFWSWELLGMKG